MLKEITLVFTEQGALFSDTDHHPTRLGIQRHEASRPMLMEGQWKDKRRHKADEP